MENEIEINEKLLGEIATVFCRNCRCFDVRSAIEGEEKCTTGFPLLCQFAQDDAQKIIARILSAVRRGDLDEALGVVGRAAWAKQGDEDHIYDWVADVIENGVRTFIALRPEEAGETPK